MYILNFANLKIVNVVQMYVCIGQAKKNENSTMQSMKVWTKVKSAKIRTARNI